MQLVLSSGGCRVDIAVDFFAPRTSSGFYWGVFEVLSAVKDQGQCGSCFAFCSQAVVSQLVLSSGGCGVTLSHSGFYAHFTFATVRSS